MPDPRDKKVAGIILGLGKPKDGAGPPEGDGGGEEMASCAEDLISAVHAKDAAGVEDALRAAFQIMESEPHGEAGEAEPSEGPPEQ